MMFTLNTQATPPLKSQLGTKCFVSQHAPLPLAVTDACYSNMRLTSLNKIHDTHTTGPPPIYNKLHTNWSNIISRIYTTHDPNKHISIMQSDLTGITYWWHVSGATPKASHLNLSSIIGTDTIYIYLAASLVTNLGVHIRILAHSYQLKCTKDVDAITADLINRPRPPATHARRFNRYVNLAIGQ